MNIGGKIAKRRKELGMTQEALAEKLSLSPQAVSRWENGWNLPDLENTRLIAGILNISPSALIGEDRKKLKFSDARVPYIIHPLMMACHALSMGLCDDKLLAVILLHDVCEDCGMTPEELPFSPEVREAVSLLTKKYDSHLSKEENEARYYSALKRNRLAAMTKVIDRCNNVSAMAASFNAEKMAEYIEETETFVFPVLSAIKRTWPEYNNAVFLIKYQMLSVLESLKIMLSE